MNQNSPQPTPPVPQPAAAAPTPAAAQVQPVGSPAPAQTSAAQAVAPKPAPKAPASSALPADQSKRNRRFLIGCLSAFGCSIFLFIGIIFAFLATGNAADNPIAKFFGVPPEQVTDVLITLVNLIFLALVFTSFIFVIIGVFKIATARKDDKDAKRRGAMFTFGALAVMVLLIVVWIFAYFFLASKRTTTVRSQIITEPANPINLTAPIAVKFDASKIPVNTRQFEVLGYEWDFGDGTKLTGNPQSHTYEGVGNYKVTLTLTLREKATGKEEQATFTRTVTVQNVRANVVIKSNKTRGGAPLTVSLDGSESRTPNGEITAYAWDLDEDGEFDDGTKDNAEASFDKIGTYTVQLRVTDSTGTFAVGTLDVEVTPPDTPNAVISVENVDGNKLLTEKAYVFSGISSTSPTGKIEKYSWDFGDGEKASTRSPTHTYEKPGEYEVLLTVLDSAKKKGEASKRFQVGAPDTAPLASIKTTPEAKDGVVKGKAPFDVIFDASGSQDPNDDIVEYAWDFDGDDKTDDTNAVTSHQFTKAGTVNVKLTITDSSNLSVSSQVVVQVEAAGLSADLKADPIAGVVPLTVKFDASGSSYREGSIVSYEWDFGDGKPPRTDNATVTYQYTAVGTFTAKVTAISSDNKRAAAEMPINVRPVPVKACFESSVKEGTSPLEVEFDPTCSTGTVVKYQWNFANLGKSTDRKPKFTFKDPGEYTVTLEVRDSQNVIDTFTDKIIVEAK